jgi:tRNA (uracil-5-)-methyltransferase
MAANTSPAIGQVHILADSEKELPVPKRQRLDIAVVSELDHLKPSTANKRDRKRQNKKQKQLEKLPEPCSSDDVLWKDIVSVLGGEAIDAAIEDGKDLHAPLALQEEVELEVKILGSNGTWLRLQCFSSY